MQLVKAGRLGILVDVADCRLCREPHGGVQNLRHCVNSRDASRETVSTAGFLVGQNCPGHRQNLSGQHFDAFVGKVVCFSAIFKQIA